MAIWNWWKKHRVATQPPLDPELNAKIQQLCQVLRDLIELLDADGETHWRAWMSTSLADLEANNIRGARHLRGAYGGMGSFNDLIIRQRMTDDGIEWAPDASKINDQLDALRSEAYGLAGDILCYS